MKFLTLLAVGAMISIGFPLTVSAQANKLATVQVYNDSNSPIVELLSYDLKTEAYSKNLLKGPLTPGKSIKIPLKAGQYYLFAYAEVDGERIEVSADYQFEVGELTYWHIDDSDLEPQDEEPYDYMYEDPYGYEE